MATVGVRPIGWIGIVIGAGLTIAFTLGADLLAMAVKSRGLAAALSVIAFFLAGLVTGIIRPTAQPLEPAIGAGATVLVFSVVQIALLRAAQPALSALQVGLSVVLAVVLAFLAAWYGARLSTRIRTARIDRREPTA